MSWKIFRIVFKFYCCGSRKPSKRPNRRRRYVSTDLTDGEIEAIREIWKRAREGNIGQKILFELLQKRPSFAAFYGIKEKLLDETTMFKCKEFCDQGDRIHHFFEVVVKSLGTKDSDQVHSMSRHIGRIHYYKGINFGADNWLAFKNATMMQMSVWQKRSSFFTNKEDSAAQIVARERPRHHSLEVPGLRNSPSMNMHCSNSLGLLAWNKLMSIIIREMKKGQNLKKIKL
ncbi:hypothetical protein WR25_15720 [Diploscapter pachys]|uniref:Uncharacterized protein n=1 Tax=Diploscapter pachys TaxID=2018661 RepID=A0A2A2J3V6_9BILA|nr:hypothetical protein WR25_15720 [Diploscapter pachys]